MFFAYPSEPFQQAVVWPATYTQPQTTIHTAPHLLMPPVAPPMQSHTMQPQSIAPLLIGASDYLAAGTTLHASVNTQVHTP